MPPTLADRLQHILEAIADVQALLTGHDLESFADDRLLRLAVERALEIVSEASRHIPEDLKQQQADTNWRALADLGNRLRHAYHRVDPELLWEIAMDRLPTLRARVEHWMHDERSS